MKSDAKTVWELYVQAWNAGPAADKRKLYAACLSPDCVYTDPLTQAKGWVELEHYMLAFQQQLPGARFVTESFLAHHGRSIARWQMISAQGVTLDSGISYGEYDAEDRLVAMTAFFQPPGSQPAA